MFEVRDLGSILISILISACVMRVFDMIISLSAVEIGSVGDVIACFILIALKFYFCGKQNLRQFRLQNYCTAAPIID